MVLREAFVGNGNLLFYFFSFISVDGRDLHTKRKGHGIVMNYLLGVFSCMYYMWLSGSVLRGGSSSSHSRGGKSSAKSRALYIDILLTDG
jgi:hypothetical protein